MLHELVVALVMEYEYVPGETFGKTIWLVLENTVPTVARVTLQVVPDGSPLSVKVTL